MTITNPPSINRTYMTNRSSGIFYKSKDAHEWKELTGWELKKQYRGKVIESPVYVGLTVYYSNFRSDIDQGIKSILDALEGICYVNDNQVYHLNVVKVKVKKGDERCEVIVAPTEL